MADGTTPSENNKHGSDWHRVLIEQINDLITVVDRDGTITYVSPAVTRILGYDPAELVGHEGYEFVHPDDQERNANALETVISNPSTPETVEVRFRHADGSWLWVEATMRNRLDDDIIDGILLSSREISKRKKYQNKAQQFAEEYESLLNNVEDAIFLLGVEESDEGIRFEFKRLSPSYERQTGITSEEVQGQTPREVFGDKQGAELEANYQDCVNASEPISYEEELHVEEDARFWQTTLAPVVADDGVTRLIGITRNVTERKERQQRLELVDRVLRHNVRNDMNVIRGRANIIHNNASGKNAKYAKQIMDTSDKLIDTTETERKMAKLFANSADPISLDVAPLLQQVVKNIEGEFPEATVTVGCPVGIAIRAEAQFRQAIEELLTNAIIHNPDDAPEVDIAVVKNAETVQIRIADTGPRIPKMEREVLIGNKKRTPLDHGSGLGLWFVQFLVSRSGGAISFEKNSPTGNIVILELPEDEE